MNKASKLSAIKSIGKSRIQDLEFRSQKLESKILHYVPTNFPQKNLFIDCQRLNILEPIQIYRTSCLPFQQIFSNLMHSLGLLAFIRANKNLFLSYFSSGLEANLAPQKPEDGKNQQYSYKNKYVDLKYRYSSGSFIFLSLWVLINNLHYSH